ncbi:MAG: hypothetical protein IVW36_11095 [Dehalococcoidia bacterium]|nr:hypothetical protein [Dehalococcoidia bacterium]
MDQNLRLLDRVHLGVRLHEELDRARRYKRVFSVLTFEEVPASDGLPIHVKMARALEAMFAVVRVSDLIARPYDDTLVVVLVETDRRGAADALFRIRQRIANRAGTWRVTTLTFPDDNELIVQAEFLRAA